MAKFRSLKRSLETALLPPAWPVDSPDVPAAAAEFADMETVSPLLALLPRGGLLGWRAVILLGRVVADIADADMDQARTIMRRCMWHMNEDSGNLGWGIAEAMGEIAAKSPALAKEYGRVILSYIRDTGFADNYIEHAPMRRGAYWAVGRLAPEFREYRKDGLELLLHGLDDEDAACRGVAAWGIRRLAEKDYPPDSERGELATRLRRERDNQRECAVLDGTRLRVEPACVFVREALKRIINA